MAVFSGRSQYELVVNGYTFSTDAASNSSVIGFQLWARVRSGFTNPGTWSSDAVGTYSLTVDGQNWSGSWTPDFRSTNLITLVNDGKTISHNADGSRTVTFTYSANSGMEIGSTTSESVNLVLTDFVRLPGKPGLPTLSRNSSGTSVSITSAVPSSPVAITQYRYAFSADGTNWSSDVSMGGSTTATLAAPSATTGYYIRTAAYSSEGWGPWSDSAFIAGIPSAPAAISTTRNARSVTVTISGSPTDGGTAITNYFVQRSNDGSTWTDQQTLVSAGSYTYTNLTAGTTWYFRAWAVNGVGPSAYTATVSTFVPAGGRRYDGATFTPTTIAKRFDGTSWIDLTVAKRYNGSTWVDLS